MPKLSEVAKFNRTMLPANLKDNPKVRELTLPGDNYILASEMVWAVLHAEAIRQGGEKMVGDNNAKGFLVGGMGPYQAVQILWPDLHKRDAERAMLSTRNHLKRSNNARCLQQAKGDLNGRVKAQLAQWWVAEEFNPITSSPAQSKSLTAKGTKRKPRVTAVEATKKIAEATLHANGDKVTVASGSDFLAANDALAPILEDGRKQYSRTLDVALDVAMAKATAKHKAKAELSAKAHAEEMESYVPHGFDLADPKHDYRVAADLVYEFLLNRSRKLGEYDIGSGGYVTRDRFGMRAPVRYLWPHLHDTALGAAVQAIRTRLGKLGLVKATHTQMWVCAAQPAPAPKVARVKNATVTDDAEFVPDDESIALPVKSNGNGDMTLAQATEQFLTLVRERVSAIETENVKLRTENTSLRARLEKIQAAFNL